MVLDPNKNTLEQEKFVETTGGETAVRVVLGEPATFSGATVSTPAVSVVTLGPANTEQSYAVPSGTKCITLQPRGLARVKVKTASGGDHFSLYPGSFYASPDLGAAPTFYFESPTAGAEIEVFRWS